MVTFDERDNRLRLDMAWGLSDRYLQGLHQRMESGIPAGRCRGCDHLMARVSGDCPLFAGMQDLAQEEGIESLICLPISRDQRREGIISAYFPSPEGPPEEQVQLLNIVATEIAAAVDGVRFRAYQMAAIYAVENLGQAEQDLSDLLQQVLDATLAGWGAPGCAILLYDEDDEVWHHQAALAISNAQLHARVQQIAVVEERFRLSREMHDGLAQTLSALGWQLERMQKLLVEDRLEAMEQELALGRRMVREAYTDVREAIDGLRLEVDHAGGLTSALEEYVADFEHRTGIVASLELEQALLPLPAETELQLLRIVQEALINSRKHAAASHVWVRLKGQSDNSNVVLTIADDGRGFDPALPRGRGHLGLSTMRERVQSLGGDFTNVTGPDQGTRIVVTLPYEQVASWRWSR